MNKQLIIELLSYLGFGLNYDQWDDPNKEWMRFKYRDSDDKRFIIIVYKHDSMETIFKQTSELLLQIGKWQKIQQIINI